MRSAADIRCHRSLDNPRRWGLGPALLALVLLGGWARTDAAAEEFFGPTPAWTGPVESTWSVALGDVDSDGDLDLVRGNHAGGATLYLNTGGTFGPTPAWTGPVENTRCVALGDVDGDGDLDLVRGNFGEGATLYLNTGGTFTRAPDWTSPGENTTSVALGDVDGDGDLDLVCGNYFEGTTLYLNTGGTFAPTPARTGPREATFSVVLGDVDGDGDLDLVRGSGQTGAALYLGSNGTFAPTARWTGPVEDTRSMALGDVDGDGDLDLVSGNYQQGSRLYLNTGGTFAPTATWTGPVEGTFSVALGDVDGDGDLDLVRGNYGGGTMLYPNTGGTFADTAAWMGPVEGTFSVALGDVDGDGDLDLVRGNDLQGATLYLNTGGTFTPTAGWTGPVEGTLSVALGDVDGDGDLDLVRGNYGGGTTLYLNTGGTFAPTAGWTGPVESTVSVALGDVDGDGDQDLVRGNYLEGTTLYLNTGGAFAPTAVWTGPVEGTRCVALGDIDGDGDLDLVCGSELQGTTLYLNTGGTFSDTAAWRGPVEVTISVALGDVDGDGDLDLIRGNYFDFSTLYLNTGGTFSDSAAWRGPVEGTISVALGDVDGDGDLDLIRGNYFEGSTLYLNTGGTFALTPAWTGPAEFTLSVALGDVDNDGDLDLVRGNSGEGATLYLNTGGTFAGAAVWTGPVEDTRSMALGDVDGDGDLDLVRGNYLEGATLYLRKSPWHLESGAPAGQLPNNPAHLRSLQVVASAPNVYRLSFAAIDAEADPVMVLCEYQIDGSASWQPMKMDGSTLNAGPFTTSVAGVPHTIDWDVALLPFGRRNATVRLRAISPPRRAGVVQFEPSYVATVGRVTPTRGVLSLSQSGLDFGMLTVGDTSTATLQISNAGNFDLIIDHIESATPDAQAPAAVGLVIPPGQTRAVEVRFAPRSQLATVGPLVIRSSDPLNPSVNMALAADVRLLTFQFQLIVASSELPLGEAATVVVIPAPLVHIEGGFVFYRARGAATFADSAAFFAQGSNFAALIPGRGVTEAGLEYFVRAENSGVLATDPPQAPDAWHFKSVTSPATVTVTALEAPGGGYPAGAPIAIFTALPEGAHFTRGRVFHRAAGAVAYDSLELAITEIVPGLNAPAASIPVASVGPRGVEYWVRVETQTATLTDPVQDPAGHPRAQRTEVATLTESAAHAGGRYRMVTVPLEFNLSAASSLESILSDQPEFGSYDVMRWRSFRWQPASGAYVEISAASTATGVLRPEPGRAFWLVARDANRIDTAPVAGRSTVPTPITLEPGWNQVGNPYAYRVAWSSVSASNASGPVALEPAVAWDEAAGRYATSDVTVLEPFTGYWVHNATADPVTLNIAPVEAVAAPAAATSSAATMTHASTDSLSWSVQITAACGAASDSRNFAGVSPSAQAGNDVLDRAEPPMAPGEALSLYFVGSEPGVRRSFDLRSALDAGDAAPQGRQWAFDMARSGETVQPAEASLTFTGLENVPAQVELRLVDRTLGRTIDLRRDATYHYVVGARGFVADEATARFALIAGTSAYVEAAKSALTGPPVRTQLLAPYPNPLAGTSLVRFELARAGRVTLEVYDFAGRRVRTLADGPREAGRFELAWRGDDSVGQRLSPGVYLLRLAGPDRADTRKIVLVQ